MRALLSIVFLGLVVADAQAAPPTAPDVLAGVQAYYTHAPTLTAKFRQEVTNVVAGRTDRSDGTLAIKQPGKLRFEYFSKKRRSRLTRSREFISDGTDAYLVDYDNQQIVQQNLSRSALPVAVAFLTGTANLATQFTPTLVTNSGYGTASDLVLELKPQQPSAQYQTLYLVVAPGDFHVRETIIVDATKNLNHFHFYEPNSEATVADALFKVNLKSPRLARFRLIVLSNAPTQPAPTQPTPAPSPRTPTPAPPARTP